MQQPFSWDSYSDQPYQLKDKIYKKRMRRNEMASLIKTFLLSTIVIPFSLISTPFIRRKKIDTNDFFSLVVDYQRAPDETLIFLDELDVSTILIRFKLWEMHTLSDLKDFIHKNKKRKIILKIMQDRENIEDHALLEKNLIEIFSSLENSIEYFEIGTTINRAKWGFFSVREYNEFYKVAYNLQQNKFKNIKLMGSGVIDFEFHYTAHTLFNFDNYHYDATSALLYVDRRGAPENSQLGFSLADKIALLSTMVWLSPKSNHNLHITETNWPISDTAPYAPTSEKECVDTVTYSAYMLRYYLLSLASQQVNTLSWHQLIAPGYGLVDNRNKLEKYPAYQVYKFMIKNLKQAQFLRLDIKRKYYILQFLLEGDILLQIHWSLLDTTLKRENDFEVYDMYGEKVADNILNISSTPLYIFIKND